MIYSFSVIYNIGVMNKKSERLNTNNRNAIYSSQQGKGTISVLTQDGNSETILRLCDNLYFMSKDSIVIAKKSVTHGCKD